MISEPLIEADLKTAEERPQQFGLMELVGLMTAVALLCALLAALLRAISPEHRFNAILIFLIQFVVLGGTVIYCSIRREQVLKVSGKRIGQGYVNAVSSVPWARNIGIGMTLLLATMQLLMMVVMIVISRGGFPWILMVSQIQLGFFAGSMFMQLRWKRDLGASEFFENGVALAPFLFTPWKLIKVRLSKLDDERIVLLFQPPNKFTAGSMTTLLVSEELKEYLLATHGEDVPSNEKSPG